MRTVVEAPNGALVALEADPAGTEDARLAAEAGLVLVREVLQLRRSLPLERPSTCRTRPFRAGADEAEFLRVNNLAFRWHPDQSDWTADDLARRLAEPWFDADGFLLLDDEDDGDAEDADRRILAFCWTKVHPPTGTDPALGEIFVIGVDPTAHGRGLGTEMVRAGLDHLAAQGLTVGMLHVEADNEPALRMYERLGFSRHSSHRWWARPGSPVPAAGRG